MVESNCSDKEYAINLKYLLSGCLRKSCLIYGIVFQTLEKAYKSFWDLVKMQISFRRSDVRPYSLCFQKAPGNAIAAGWHSTFLVAGA